ncbi:NADH-quinone oxidoreductase subunit J [Actinomyces oricola]
MTPLAHALPTMTASGAMSTGETILFGVVAVVTVLCGLGLLTAKQAVSAAINTTVSMICLAVPSFYNEAPFPGIHQVVVYTGAVMTLVLFVIMLVGVGGEEPMGGTTWPAQKPLVVTLGVGLVAVLTAAVVRNTFPAAQGLADSTAATPQALALTLFGNHVAAMELTGVLLIIAALGALTLTHRQRVRAKRSQRQIAEDKMRAYAQSGAHPGQRPMPGVYASTNTAAAPALDASGDEVHESVPRVLRVRGQALELSEVSPEVGAAQRAGRMTQRENASVGRSGMASMPGAPAPVVAQPTAPAKAKAAPPAGSGPGEAPAEGESATPAQVRAGSTTAPTPAQVEPADDEPAKAPAEGESAVAEAKPATEPAEVPAQAESATPAQVRAGSTAPTPVQAEPADDEPAKAPVGDEPAKAPADDEPTETPAGNEPAAKAPAQAEPAKRTPAKKTRRPAAKAARPARSSKKKRKGRKK